MKQKEYFSVKNLSTVVFLGYLSNISKLITHNKKLKINSSLITGSDQAKHVPAGIKHNIFNKIDGKFKKFIQKNYDIKSTLFISLGARYIFKKNHINDIFSNNLINYHAARLPFDAGGGGWTWRIMKHDRIDNQLFHVINEKIDAGSIIKSQLSLMPKECITPIEFEKFRQNKFLIFYGNFIKDLKKGLKFKLKDQPKYFGNYYPRLKTRYNGWIDWNLDSHELLYFINSFDDPFEGASTFINNRVIKKAYIKKVQIHGGEQPNHPYMTGLVLKKYPSWIVVATVDKYCLIIEEILDEKGNNIINKIKVGDRFFSKKEILDKAKSVRVYFDAKGIKK